MELVQAALIGSILATAVLILGAAIIAGSVRYGVLEFASHTPRMIAVLLMLAVSALVLPTVAYELHLPAGQHKLQLAVACAIVLLSVFAVSTWAMLRDGQRGVPVEARKRRSR